MNTLLDYPSFDDARLIELHRTGDRAAFRQIVDRYKSMVCAVAYSACGDLARSEDLAQEVFVAAWKQLATLREPEKLRGWLGGIARNVSHSFLRREGRLVSGNTETLSAEIPAQENDPRQQAITTDEAALMWRALAEIGETYREPMILFYREQRSVQAVAETLGISDENVRQRLTRGRAMLSERMAAIVEETLERAVPTTKLTGIVMLALPVALSPLTGGVITAKAAASGGSAAVKGGLLVKAIALVGVLPALFNGLGDYLSFRAKQASVPPQDRPRVERLYLVMKGSIALMIFSLLLAGWGGPIVHLHSNTQVFLFVLAIGLPAWMGLRAKGQLDRLTGNKTGEAFEYRSPETLLGFPLVHVRLGGRKSWRKPAVRGWIALSDTLAVGPFMAFGPVAIAPVSFGGLALGIFALGGVAAGGFTIGWASIGWMTEGGVAAGWVAARGGITYAHEFAQGAIAMAAHANDNFSKVFFAESDFFKFSNYAWRWAFWAAWFAWLPPLLMTLWMRWKARRMKDAGNN